jgi:hypothetical protein
MPDELEAERLAVMLEAVPRLLAADPALLRRGHFLDARFQVGIGSIPFDLNVQGGRIVTLERGPFLMRSWRFAVRGTAEGWDRLWQPVPAPGWHDLLALTKRGCASIEGDLQPLMANLQYVKDLLVLPRRLRSEQA